MRRGLTLVEVVAAAALLTLIVAACLPLIAGARRDLEAARAVSLHEPVEELAEAVDELLRERPGLIEEVLDQPSGLRVSWTVRDVGYEAEVRLRTRVEVRDDEHRSAHAWAVFRLEGVEIPRWLRLPGPPKESTP